MRKDIATVCMTDSNSGWNDGIGKTENFDFNNTIFTNTTIEKRAHRKKIENQFFSTNGKNVWLFITKN